MTTRCCSALLLGWLLAGPAHAQLGYNGPPGAEVMRQARQLRAAGDRAGAAAAYQRAYAAFTSADDSNGMTAALAAKKAVEGETAGAAPARTATAFQAAGDKAQTAAAYGKSATASERYADQLLGGAGAPAAARPVATQRAAPPAPAGPAPQAGRLVGGKPVGLFFVTKSVLGRFMTLTYYFSPEGVAYENPPGLSAAELAATPAKSKGRYSVAGKTLTIAWNGYPKPEAADMNPLTGGFSWSLGSIFSGVGPFKSAAQLVGSFEGGTSSYTPMGGAVVSKSLTFRADGTYTSSGVATVASVTERSVAETGGSSQQGGRWRLDGWFLTLTDAQGHRVRDIAYPVGTGKVDLFNFNGLAYTRQ